MEEYTINFKSGKELVISQAVMDILTRRISDWWVYFSIAVVVLYFAVDAILYVYK